MCGTGFELTFWVCTALCVFWLPVTSSRPLLPHVHQFQVVWPERLPTPRARRSLDSHWNLYPDSVSYALGAGEHSFTLHLRKNRNLLASGYTETYTAANGSEVVEQLGELDHCFYQGHVEGHQDSATSISTCDGLRGFFQAGSTVHLIEPLDGEEEGRHALYLVQHLKAKPPKANHSTCGVSNANLMHILGPRIAAAFRPRSQLLPQVPRHVELYVVTDSTETQRYGDRDTLRSRVLQVVNHVDKLYQALSLRVVLVGLEMWTKDKIVVSPEPEITLANFQAWREQELLPQHPNDNAQFITNVDFTGLTVGLATVSAMCSRKVSAGVNQDQNSHYLFLASTIAHEMGHNLAMDHDENVHGCYCTVPQAEGGCVMATSMGTKYPKRFSQCSQADYEAFADTPQTECLLGELDTSKLISDPLCGNKLLERGEQCDCGSPQECKNPCCNATSCHLVPGAACAQGPCCDKCQVKPAGELCRGRKDMCDLEEYCDGHGPECPKDTFQENGTPCTEGYCYNGACPTMEERCRKLWGPDAQASEDICFTYDLLPSCHSRLQPKGVDRCTILFCQGGQQPQMHGSCTIKPQGKHCQALFVEQGGAYELVPVGTRCGEGKVCWESHCQDLDVYRIKNCSAKCNGHGVCNHENKCHCQPGWAPPHCAQPGSTVTTRKTTVSTGLSKGAVVGVVLSVLWLILLLVGIFLYHSRHKRYVAPKTSLGLANALFHKGPGDSTLRNSRAAAPTMDPPQVVSTTASPHHPRLSYSTGTPMQPLPIQLGLAPPSQSLLELKSKQVVRPIVVPQMPPAKPISGILGPSQIFKPPAALPALPPKPSSGSGGSGPSQVLKPPAARPPPPSKLSSGGSSSNQVFKPPVAPPLPPAKPSAGKSKLVTREAGKMVALKPPTQR